MGFSGECTWQFRECVKNLKTVSVFDLRSVTPEQDIKLSRDVENLQKHFRQTIRKLFNVNIINWSILEHISPLTYIFDCNEDSLSVDAETGKENRSEDGVERPRAYSEDANLQVEISTSGPSTGLPTDDRKKRLALDKCHATDELQRFDNLYTLLMNPGVYHVQLDRTFELDLRMILDGELPPSMAVGMRRLQELLRAMRRTLQQEILAGTRELLVRPGRRFEETYDIHFLLFILANPYLHAGPGHNLPGDCSLARQMEMVKRVVGMIAQLPKHCHLSLKLYFQHYPKDRLRQLLNLLHTFIRYRLERAFGKVVERKIDPSTSLVPQLDVTRRNVGNDLRATMEVVEHQPTPPPAYTADWRLIAAARFMTILFSANWKSSTPLPIEEWYDTEVDSEDILLDFELFERRSVAFTFCNFPCLMTLGSKIIILEHDSQRNMQDAARSSYYAGGQEDFNVVVTREDLAQQSLRKIEIAPMEELKKNLKVKFMGEDAIDAGGPRKEWFDLVLRHVFDPDYGTFPCRHLKALLLEGAWPVHTDNLIRHVRLRR